MYQSESACHEEPQRKRRYVLFRNLRNDAATSEEETHEQSERERFPERILSPVEAREQRSENATLDNHGENAERKIRVFDVGIDAEFYVDALKEDKMPSESEDECDDKVADPAECDLFGHRVIWGKE